MKISTDSLSIEFPIAICDNLMNKYYSSIKTITAKEILDVYGWIESAKKEMVPLFSPIYPIFDGVNYGNRRLDSNVDLVTAMVLDFDTGEHDVADITRLLSPNGFVGHTTWSHSEACNKFRVIAPLSEPVKANKWKSFLKVFTSERGLVADPKCCNPSRIFYFPSHRPGITSDEWFSFQNDGIPIDTELYLEMAEKAAPEKRKIIKPSVRLREKRTSVDWNTLDILSFIQSMGWEYREFGEKIWIYCPWRHTHSDPSNDSICDAFMGWMPNGRPMFHCSHAHCQNRWLGDIMREFDAEKFCRPETEV